MNMSTRSIAWAPLSAASSRAKTCEVRLSIHAARTDTHGANASARLDIEISNDVAQAIGIYAPGSTDVRHAAVYCADGLLLVCRRENGVKLTGQVPQSVYKVGGRSTTAPNSARCFATALPPFCVTEARRATTADHRVEDEALIIHVPKDFLLTSVAPVALAPEPVPQPATDELQPADRLPLPFDSTRLPDAPDLIVSGLGTEPVATRPHDIDGVAEEIGGSVPASMAAPGPAEASASVTHEPTVDGLQHDASDAPALSDAAGRVLKALTDCAAAGEPCPTNRELSDRADCTEQDASNLMAALERAGFIHRTFVDRAGKIHPVYAKGRGRIVEIVSTGQKTNNPFAVPTPPEKPTGGGASAPKPVVEQPTEEERGHPAVSTIEPPRPAKVAPVSKPRGRSGELSDAEREALEIVRATAASKESAEHGMAVVDEAINWLRTIRHVIRPDGTGGYRMDNKPMTGDGLVEFANQRRAARGLPPLGAVDAVPGRAA